MSWFMWHYTGNGTVTMGTVDSDSIAGDESGRYGCVGRWWAGGENNSSFGTNASLNYDLYGYTQSLVVQNL
jgi:hypothetical protein